MKRPLPEYLTRGGTLTAIAKAWGVSLSYVSNLIKIRPDEYYVEFNVMTPSQVLKFWVPEKQMVREEKVFFEVAE